MGATIRPLTQAEPDRGAVVDAIGQHAVVGDLVVSEAQLDAVHLTVAGRIKASALIALAEAALQTRADATVELGAVDFSLVVTAAGDGPWLTAETHLLHQDAQRSVWRTKVMRGAAHIADITATGMKLPARSGEVAPADAQDEPSSTEARSVRGERLQKLLDGATAVIAKKGFANASIRDIAAATGMPIATIYHYVRSKDDLLKLIYRSLMEDINANVQARVDAVSSPGEKLEQALRAYMVANDQHHRHIKLMFQESNALTAADRREIYRLDQSYVRLWSDILREGAASGEFDIEDVDLVADFILFLTAIWVLRHWSIGPRGLDRVTDTMLRFISKAVRAEPGRPEGGKQRGPALANLRAGSRRRAASGVR
jgi:AcrR family transcriptional regulator